jgi:hypothetical protein
LRRRRRCCCCCCRAAAGGTILCVCRALRALRVRAGPVRLAGGDIVARSREPSVRRWLTRQRRPASPPPLGAP